MKKLILIPILICAFISPLSAENDLYVLKATKYHLTYYAEWGIHGEEMYEDRYDGMEFEIWENDKLLGKIVVFQHWFKPGRKAYPKVGEFLTTEKFDFSTVVIPGEGANIEYDSLKIITPSVN